MKLPYKENKNMDITPTLPTNVEKAMSKLIEQAIASAIEATGIAKEV